MNYLQQFFYVSDLLLQLLLVILLLRGPFSKYLVFSFYAVAELASDAAEGTAYYRLGWASHTYRQIYWTDQIALDLLLFLVVITLTYQALGESPMRRTAGKALGAIGIAALILPFALLHSRHTRQYGYFSSQWFNNVNQILNFGAAIMNLVLWVALLSNRRRDPRLVTLSIGVGIVTTGAAIGWGARQWLPQGNRWLVDTFLTATHLAGLMLWCWIFRARQAPSVTHTAPPGVPPTAPPDALTTPS